jgi:DNA (cytosine-5)-methyltransferase 1
VIPAPLDRCATVVLCGLMFGLRVFRHRAFESSLLLMVPPHPSHRGLLIGRDGMCCVVGHGGGVSRRMRSQIARLNRHGSGGQQNKAEWQAAMGIDWMSRDELAQAVPPAYTEFLGLQLINALEDRP